MRFSMRRRDSWRSPSSTMKSVTFIELTSSTWRIVNFARRSFAARTAIRTARFERGEKSVGQRMCETRFT